MKKIELTQGKYTLVDDKDFEWLNQWKWCYSFYGYAIRNKNWKNGKPQGLIYMHRLINNTPNGLHTDHINRNKLDNRRENLRSATDTQNAINKGLRKDNTSKIIGVSLFRNGKWRSYITFKKQTIHLGYFRDIEEARFTRKNAERIYHHL
jgi:hypothetical protein